MAKHVESEWSAKAGEKLSFGSEFGILAGRLCFYPMLEFGKKAVEDAKAGIVSEELEKILLNIIYHSGNRVCIRTFGLCGRDCPRIVLWTYETQTDRGELSSWRCGCLWYTG